MKNRIIPLLAFALVFVLLVGCGRESRSSKPQIIVSLYPLQDFAQKIGGNLVEVTNIVPPGTEPHDFDPSPQDMIKLNKADLFLYNGAGLEAWVNHAIPNIDQTHTLVVNTSAKIPLKKAKDLKEVDQVYDPHVWLNPYMAEQQAKVIYDSMIKIDPKHKKEFTENYQRLNKQFIDLQKSYESLLHTPSREFVTSHAAFQYLADQYHLKQVAISGLSPEDEPSPKAVKQLVDMLRKHKAKVVFFETLVNNKLADTVKNEIHAEAIVLNPLEGLSKQEIANKEDYFSVMKSNLINLKKALGGANG
ncbi:zinc ABC transporter substrate-binding protein [Shimazuella sp. AN120528]|uniref:metal ABC transporter solute-binding protein, Zn/Mn family n=1 Tax=Shimazuella soli TaxID=1892854 RepID=UPI001F0ED928|nr:zinc ABC transporter substrate-binding protein [Shimazuella soli]MCH5585008.1 zinc ABC transporter substrate-binding protein [Shimazuella soli]